jgi:hypothetical protein
MNNAKRISIGPLVYADKPKKAMTMMSSAPKMAHATTSGSGRFVQFMRFFILSSVEVKCLFSIIEDPKENL